MQSVDEVLRQAAADLEAIGARWADLGYLIAAATGADLEEATAAAALIEERGFNRGQSLSEDLAAIISQAQKNSPEPSVAAIRDLDTYWRSGAVDVHYSDAGGGTAALVVGGEPTLAMVLDEHVANVPRVAPYEPGALYKRELPCIRAVLALNGPLDLLVVDGYATLDPGGRPGLGAYAADAFNLPVIGVAKTPFRAATHAIEVIRGSATRPLYVTAAGGIGIDEAAHIVAGMAGPHRVPSALARADRLARGRAQPVAAGGTR